MGDLEDRLWALLGPYLEAEDLELDDVEVRGQGGRHHIRVTIDAENGVDIDRIAETSRSMSRLLDGGEPIFGSYTLEVSSPGLERRLKRPAHFRKAVGREVKVKVRSEDGSVELVEGVLYETKPEGVTLTTGLGSRFVPFDSIASASTVFDWKPAPRPGKSR